MKSTIFWALAALNAILLAGLIAPHIGGTPAVAQGARRPELLMIPGEIIGGNSAVVYLIDTNNRRLGAVALGQNNALVSMPAQNLSRLFDDAPAGEDDEDVRGRDR